MCNQINLEGMNDYIKYINAWVNSVKQSKSIYRDHMHQFISYSLIVGELDSRMAMNSVASAIPRVQYALDKGFKSMVEFRMDYQDRRRKEKELREAKSKSQSPERKKLLSFKDNDL